MNTNASPSLYEKCAARRVSSVSLRSSSARIEMSSFCAPGTEYMMKRNVTLPPRPCGELRSISRICQALPLYSTTLPFLMSAAFMGEGRGERGEGRGKRGDERRETKSRYGDAGVSELGPNQEAKP